MKYIFSLLFLFCVTPLFAQNAPLMGSSVYGTANGVPLTTRNSSFTYQPMPEPRTFKEQDLVTIIVNKSELYVNNSNLQRQRKIEGTMGLTDWVRFPSWKKIPEPILTEPPVIGGEIDHTSRSKGQLNNVEKLEFMITCRVLNKLPNGLLFVEGDDDQTVGEEKKVIHVSGYLSPEAIGEDNTVQSDRLYSRKIRVIPSGNVFDSTKRGYGQRWMERWMPF